MIEKIIKEVCRSMSADLTTDQLQKLEAVLCIQLKDVKIQKQSYDIEPAETYSDARAVKEFLASKRIGGRADSTLQQYSLEIWKCRTTIGKSFKDITTLDLKAYLGILREYQKNSLTTINNKRRYLNSFFGYLSNEGIITGNPVSRIEAIKEPQRRKKAYSAEDLEAMRAKCGHVRDRALLAAKIYIPLWFSEESNTVMRARVPTSTLNTFSVVFIPTK